LCVNAGESYHSGIAAEKCKRLGDSVGRCVASADIEYRIQEKEWEIRSLENLKNARCFGWFDGSP